MIVRPRSTNRNHTLPVQIIGIDIGGTKCAVSVLREGVVEEVARFPTQDFAATFALFRKTVERLAPGPDVVFGLSCGGPLDAARGAIRCPPNLPGWVDIAICRAFTDVFGGRAFLMNDANASALAEWHFGAGEGCNHMVFLTAGTGMGAGLILNGRLYEGATGDAGEVGHLRLRPDGPLGFGKLGSFEGFCSGGGIARLAADLGWKQPGVTLREIAESAAAGDGLALKVIDVAGERLGEALELLIDTLNPERIVLGGFFPRCSQLLLPAMNRALQAEALPGPRAACRIVPAKLGETIGSHAAVAVALHALDIFPVQPNRKPAMSDHHLTELLQRLPELTGCQGAISSAYQTLRNCFQSGGKILLCGNGGSAADADHWAGELLKGFRKERPLSAQERGGLRPGIAAKLQGALPAIPLTSFPAASTAFGNDVDPELAYAQLIWALGRPGDVFVGLSTSGGAENVCAAAEVARAKGLRTIALTGAGGGKLKGLCDVCICAPSAETHRVQEYHLPIYHCLSLMLEEHFFGAPQSA